MHGMSRLETVDKQSNFDFQWGTKRVVANTNVQFYESFTYDSEDYSLFDCVYMWRDEQAEPDIGVIVKIWETPRYEKKVKVIWFFRPSDISNFLGDNKPLKNEIFLASGEGKGLANLNPLLAIAGKCNVVCTSKNNRNPQASDAELRMADFIFYRTFDVGTYMLSDKFPDRIAGIKVDCFFNKKKEQNLVSDPKVDQNSKDRAKKVGNEKFSTSTENQPFKKRKLLTDLGDSLPELPSNVSASKCCEGSSANIMQTSDIKDSVTKLSDPLQRLPEGKEEAFDIKTLGGRISGLCMEIEKARNISQKSSFLLAKDKCVKPENQPFEVTKMMNDVADIHFLRLLEVSNATSALMRVDELLTLHTLMHKKLSKFQIPDDFGGYPNVYLLSQLQDKKRCFKPLSWEDKMKKAHEQGTLVFLENLNPSHSSSEVKDIVWQALNEKVDIKMIERSTFSSPHSGKAFVIFTSKVAADTAINKLKRGCLILPNGSPLIAYRRTPAEGNKAAKLVGHLELDRIRLRKQRKDLNEAVATSHCSQPNNIEYDLAVKWWCLQERTDALWFALHQEQAFEIRKLKSTLKYKANAN